MSSALRTKPAAARGSGVVLMDVVFATALFFICAAAVVGGLNSATRAAGRLRAEAIAGDLLVTLLSEIQMGIVEAADTDPQQYDEPLDQWTWQIVTGPPHNELNPAAPPDSHLEIVVANTALNRTWRLVQILGSRDGTDEMAYAPERGNLHQ